MGLIHASQISGQNSTTNATTQKTIMQAVALIMNWVVIMLESHRNRAHTAGMWTKIVVACLVCWAYLYFYVVADARKDQD